MPPQVTAHKLRQLLCGQLSQAPRTSLRLGCENHTHALSHGESTSRDLTRMHTRVSELCLFRVG